jgi:hypothetical protein
MGREEDTETDRACGRRQAHLWTRSGEGRDRLGSDGLTGRVGRRRGGAGAGSNRRGRIGDPVLSRSRRRVGRVGAGSGRRMGKAPRRVQGWPLEELYCK